MNDTLMKQANWNATNTSYFSNITNFGVNLTDTKFCVYNATIDKLNCSYTSTDTDTFAVNYSDYLSVKNYALNDSLWTLNYSTYLTKPTYAQTTNGTILMRFQDWNATNTSYFSNLTNFAVNLTDTKFCVYNLSIDKLNCSYSAGGGDTFAENYSNFTTLYGNQLGNASNMTTIYGYAINDSLWTLNYSDYLTTRAYSLNDSLWTLNYSTYLTKPTWAQVTNGTMLSYAQALNTTLLQQANWNATNTSYVTYANWNATNTSYYLATNPFAFYNSTNPSPDTRWNANY